MKWLVVISCVLFCVGASTARAQTTPQTPRGSAQTPPEAVDRRGYNLFNPTPESQLRDFAPDRPNVTNGPYTVDPGHVMLEVGLVEYARDRFNGGGYRLDGFAFGDTNIRVGVTNVAEVDLAFTAYRYVRLKYKAAGAHTQQGGFGDVTVRSKINLIGDDGGSVAVALLPSVTVPTASNGLGNRGFEGGLGLPIQFALPAGFQLGVESVAETTHNPGGGSFFDYANSVSLGHSITKKLGTYLEFATDVPTYAHQGWIGTVDTGLVYQAGDNWEVDAGVNIGVTKAADDAFPFLGASWRF